MDYFFQEGTSSDHLVVLFHGTGGNEYQLLPIAGQFFPQASLLSFSGNYGEGVARRFFPPLIAGELDRPAFDQAVAQFLAAWPVVDIQAKKITLMGYSNGANFILGLLEKITFQVDTAILLHPSNLGYHFTQPASETKVIMTSGANDYLSPAGSILTLEQQMKPVFKEVQRLLLDGGHSIDEQEINEVRKQLD